MDQRREGTVRLYVAFSPEAWDTLREVARRERRRPQDEAALPAAFVRAVDSPLRPRTLAEMRSRPKLTHLIDRVLPAGLTPLLYRPSGDGHTALVLGMACPLALRSGRHG